MDNLLFLVAFLMGLGCFTGFMAGLLGIGGGMIITPFLTFLLTAMGTPPTIIVKVAIATSLGTIVFTSLSSIRAHAKRGAVLWNVALMATPGILVGSWLGAKLMTMLPAFLVTMCFACFVAISAAKMFMNAKPKPTRHLPGKAGLAAVGGFIGCLSGLMGAGGGFISVPYMVWCNVNMHNAVATSAAMGFPIAFAGTLSYVYQGWGLQELQDPMYLGYIYLPALAAVACMSVVFAPLGARVAHAMDTGPLKKVFACMLCCMACYMTYHAFAHI